MPARLNHAHVRPDRAGDQRDQHPDRPAPDHHHPLAGPHPGARDIVHRHRRRLHQRRVIERKRIGQGHQRVGGHGPPLLHRAGRVDTDKIKVLAHMPMAAHTRRTRPIPAQRHHRHRITRRPALHTFTHPHHPPRHLMPDHHRSLHPTIHITMENMQIRATDPHIRGRQLHLTETRRRSVSRTSGQGAGAGVADGERRGHLSKPFHYGTAARRRRPADVDECDWVCPGAGGRVLGPRTELGAPVIRHGCWLRAHHRRARPAESAANQR